MAQDLLLNTRKPHKPEYDLESMFYIIIYMCILQEGPNGMEKTEGRIPSFLYDWLHPETITEQGLGTAKLGLINYSSDAFSV